MVYKAEELIDKAVNGDAPIYHGGDVKSQRIK